MHFAFSPWLRLVRWPNLLIIALTQWVAWWCVIYPVFALTQQPVFQAQWRVNPSWGPHLVLTPQHFVLLCLSTVLIAAGGYIINDYFDVRIDVINKPGKVILEKEIPRKLAIVVHSVLNVVALVLAAFVAIPAGHPEWLLLQLACTLLLWIYSTTWKRKFMIGNVVVSLMTAFTVVALIIYEPSVSRIPTLLSAGWHTVFGWPLSASLEVFALFAFLLTWMREIVKDMEDFKGDDAEGCVTMPIKWGLLRSTRFVQMLGLFAVMLLTLAAAVMLHAKGGFSRSAFLVLIFIVFPLLRWMYLLPKAATASHYHKSSSGLKWIMVTGIASFLLVNMLHYV